MEREALWLPTLGLVLCATLTDRGVPWWGMHRGPVQVKARMLNSRGRQGGLGERAWARGLGQRGLRYERLGVMAEARGSLG